MTARKARSDSTQAAIAQHKAAQEAREHHWPAESVTLPPDPVKAESVSVIWRSLQKSRPHEYWLPGDLILLAHLSLSLRQADEYNQQLERFGAFIKSGKSGNQLTRSPILDVLQTTLARCQSLSSKLGIGSISADSRTIKNEARSLNAINAEMDPLLAGYDDHFRV